MSVELRCMFDENLLGLASKLLELPNLKSLFINPEDFVDDIHMQGIRGLDDEAIVKASTTAGRMIITPDIDFLFTAANRFGTIVLRGGLQGDNGRRYPFHRLIRKAKYQVILNLFTNHLADMKRIYDEGQTEIAVVSGTCNLSGKGRGQEMIPSNTSNILWKFRSSTDEEKEEFLALKERQRWVQSQFPSNEEKKRLLNDKEAKTLNSWASDINYEPAAQHVVVQADPDHISKDDSEMSPNLIPVSHREDSPNFDAVGIGKV